MKHIYRTILPCVVALFCCLLPVFSITGEHPVLIISSYNPDAGRTSSNISDFMEEFQRLGGTNTVALENMNCKSFSEAPFWEKRMAGLLSKYQNDKSPALIVLIGQEAWAAYLSLEDSVRGNTQVVSALSSRNAILLPGDTIDLKTWMPESVDFFTDFPDSPIKAGFVYEYDVEANINMVKQMYPDTENIAFISDNSYGGVAMQAYVVKEMKKFPELDLILLDGRVNTIYTICDRLHELPEHTAVLMGTWRVDMNDGYFMRNATYAMMEAAPALPTFSLSSAGLGYWAVAGIVPAYRALGKEMARQSYRLLTDPQDGNTHMEVIPNETILDGKLVKEKEQNNLDQKTVICEIVEGMEYDTFTTFADWEDKTNEILALQAKWKTIGYAPQKMNVKIFERFRAACDEFFRRKAAFFKSVKETMAANLEKKKAFCEKAEALKESTDWKETAEILTKLQKEWKTIGPVAKKHSDAVWKRFIGACDYFFERKNKATSSQRSEEVENLAKKEDVIKRMAALEAAGTADDATAEQVRALMKEWNAIGFVPFKEKDRLYKEFHALVDKLFDRLHLSATEKRLSSVRTNGNKEGNLYRDRERLVRTYEGLKNDIQTYENNLGFLNSSSKKGNTLVADITRKIERLKKDMELVLKKIKDIDESLKEKE